MRRTVVALTLVALLGTACRGFGSGTSRHSPLVVGAVYPISGSQGPGGTQEYRGVQLAATMANAAGGIRGRPIQVRAIDTPDGDAAPGAIAELASAGAKLVLGSYGSTISLPAAAEAASRGMLFWETGAVGDMTGAGLGRLVFRVAPTGASLGRAAIGFVAASLAPLLHRPASSLRFAVANVDDVYGRTVARGALQEIRALGLPLAGQFPYDPQHPDVVGTVHAIASRKPDVLFVSAYLQDGVALRRETVRQRVHLLASIGTSSSYCMPMFGAALGRQAVGLFASDKPDADALNPRGLSPAARSILDQARTAYQRRYHEQMAAPALAGFSAAWALFRDVLPRAPALTPSAVAAVAARIRLPVGSLPNGSGLAFGASGSPDAGANLDATSVIWEWVGIDRRAVVWPPMYSTTALRVLPLAA